MALQTCSSENCKRPVAFGSRTKPSWCDRCQSQLIRDAGLQALATFTSRVQWQLTQCLQCGVQAHYRLETILDKKSQRTPACHACELRNRPNHPWADPLTPEQMTGALAEGNYELLSSLGSDLSNEKSPLQVRCRGCGRIVIKRVTDLGWGCPCSRNSRGVTRSSPGKQPLLVNSGLAILGWWDPAANTEQDRQTVSVRGTRTCHWICPDCGHRFSEQVRTMVDRPGCPACRHRRMQQDRSHREQFRDVPIAEIPELAEAWADEDDPWEITLGDWGLRRFRCTQGHHPRISPSTFLASGCPHCRGKITLGEPGHTLADLNPELAEQWHPSKNGRRTPKDLPATSKKDVWWLADCCGREWVESPFVRDKYQRWRCENCRTILDSLAWSYPGLASEWSSTNPKTAWQVRPTAATSFVPEWVCSLDPAHVWSAPLASRSSGSGCPECRIPGKSQVELDHCAAAAAVFGSARSGQLLRDPAFTHRGYWSVDIVAESSSGQRIAIEYDGAYWHSSLAKQEVDRCKSRDLLAAGYYVVRLREDDLEGLGIDHPRYAEQRVYSQAADPAGVITEIARWLSRDGQFTDTAMGLTLTTARRPHRQ